MEELLPPPEEKKLPAPEEKSFYYLEGKKQVIKYIVLILLLVFTFPIGLSVMWLWLKKWPFLAKFLITILPLLAFISSLQLYAYIANYEADKKNFMLKAENSQLRMQIDNIKQQSLPTPTAGQKTSQIIPLSTVWQMGTTTYTNPKLGISFEYPKVFTVDVADVSSDVTFSMRINSQDIPIEQRVEPGFDWTAYDKNAMTIEIVQDDNSSNQTLDTFLSSAYVGPGVDGKTPVINILKRGLIASSAPVPGSYVFTGTLGETPSKIYYFMNKDKIYSITLWGGHNAGNLYSKDAEKVFDQIISSIKFTQ